MQNVPWGKSCTYCMHIRILAEKFRSVALKLFKIEQYKAISGVKVLWLPPNARKTRNVSTTEHFAFKVAGNIYYILTWCSTSGTTLFHAFLSRERLVHAAINQQLPREPWLRSFGSTPSTTSLGELQISCSQEVLFETLSIIQQYNCLKEQNY